MPMSITGSALIVEKSPTGKIVEVTVSGRLTADDYEMLVPEIDRLIDKHGTLRLIAHLVDFRGWTVGALWEDTKFDARHFTDFERIAIVGDLRWEKGMAAFCKPFTTASVRFFADLEDAEQWITEGLAST